MQAASSILVVEDLDSDYEFLARRFRRIPLEPPVVRFRNLAEAGNKLMNPEAFGLIVLDLCLPDGDGRELLPRLEGSPAPIVVWTALTDPELAGRCEKQGIECVVHKTIDPEAAHRSVDRIASYWQASRR